MNDLIRQRRRDTTVRDRILQRIVGTRKPQAFAENPHYEKLIADPELAAVVMTRGLRKDLDAYIAAKAQQEAK